MYCTANIQGLNHDHVMMSLRNWRVLEFEFLLCSIEFFKDIVRSSLLHHWFDRDTGVTFCDSVIVDFVTAQILAALVGAGLGNSVIVEVKIKRQKYLVDVADFVKRGCSSKCAKETLCVSMPFCLHHM